MSKKIFKCRSCSSTKLKSVIDLGNQPLANSLKKNKTKQKEYPLHVVFCSNCKLLQLNTTVDPKLLFNNYLWVTGTSDGVKLYRDHFIKKILHEHNPDKKILEIASNDGYFLKGFKNKGYKVMGIDPAKNIVKKANREGVKTLPYFFNKKTATLIKRNYFNPDIIICRNVIPHVENINSVISGIEHLLEEDGRAYIEFHYAENLSKNLHYDYIYHEHIFYYTVKSIMHLLEKHNLFAYDYFVSPISGGSIVLNIKKKQSAKTKKLLNLINCENKIRINSLKYWKSFTSKSLKHKNDLINILNKLKKKNVKIFGYGASARSSTLINYCKFDSKDILGIFDKNTLKKNLYTAGSNIKILTPNINKIRKADYIIILAWNFEKEIVKFLKSIHYKNYIISVLPKIKVQHVNKKNKI